MSTKIVPLRTPSLHHQLAKILVTLAVASASLAGVATAATPPIYDQILVNNVDLFVSLTLPNGELATSMPRPAGLGSIQRLPSGMLVGITSTLSTPQTPSRLILNEVLGDGSLRQIGILDRPSGLGFTETPGDLACDSEGQLFLLTYLSFAETGAVSTRLVQIEPANAATLASRTLSEHVGGLAMAPKGLWTFSSLDNSLLFLNPESGDLGPSAASLEGYDWVSSATSDSAGRVYFIYSDPCPRPSCSSIASIDPEKGAVRAETFLQSQTRLPRAMTIDRRCDESNTARCLQGGRFRAEVTFADPAGTMGTARVAAGRSGDTGLFYFFDPANWELMVKVLDGCALNGAFWVFSSASTDVAFTLEVTDTQTLASKTYQNPPGQIARTVADTNAFACSL